MEGLESACLSQLGQTLPDCQTRHQFIDAVGELAISDPDTCIKGDWPLRCWRAAFYRPIEQLRKLTKDPAKGRWATASLLQIIDEGLGVYLGMIRSSCETYQIADFNDLFLRLGLPFITGKSGNNQDHPTRKALYHFFIASGDLARYKVQYNPVFGSHDRFNMARSFYLAAHQCQPNQGHPHNMLALLASHQGNVLEALYRYVRCLICDEPAPLGKDNLKTFLRQISSTDNRHDKLVVLVKDRIFDCTSADLIKVDPEIFLQCQTDTEKLQTTLILVALLPKEALLDCMSSLTFEETSDEGKILKALVDWIRGGTYELDLALFSDLQGFNPLRSLISPPQNSSTVPDHQAAKLPEEDEEEDIVLFTGVNI